MATIVEADYGTQTTVAFTLTSLATGSTWQSTAVNNSSTLALDYHVILKTKTAAGTPAGTPTLDLVVVGSIDGGTTWPDGVTGTDGTITVTANTKFRPLGSLTTAAASTAYIGGPFSVLDAFGGVAVPQRWAVIALNNTGVSLSATAGDHVLQIQPVLVQLV